MDMNREDAKREVAQLVERLREMKPGEFKRYDEENTKKDFILPLFRALGWDIERRREVTAEDRVSRGHVDYAFRLDSRIAFFLEAKPLRANLDKPKYARQAIDYAWTKGVTWAVLTDFEGLKLFNAEWMERDLRKNIVKDIPFTEYEDRFEELWLLSKPAMEAALLDKEAEKWGKKTRKKPIDEQLFEDLVKWRWELRRHLGPYNREYTTAQIDQAVQRILDRLIFIRAAEDRGIEQERLLLSLVREWREGGRRKDLLWLLNQVFRDFDEGYDSALFGRHFSEDLDCESKPFEDTILGLYQTTDGISEYDFNAIDADVLGGIYEQYLGYAQGLAKEEAAAKRARRKSQGIYYTPQFVADYIVQNTVGRLLEERTHHEILNLRILDPACGSGSFLIGAFDAFDQYHQGLSGDVASGLSPTKQAGYPGEIFDLARRVQILTENLYGVDLDPQAVEIAQLNLLLKTLTRRERLPNLNPNIRRGNSLISGTPRELSEHFGDAWEEKHPFNWDEQFPKIMAKGGFDAVIGNPPYLFGEHVPAREKDYFKDFYEVSKAQFDVFWLFYERCLSLLKPGGYHGFIVPDAILARDEPEILRQLILQNAEIVKLVHVGEVFPASGVSALITVIRRTETPAASHVIEVDHLDDGAVVEANRIPQRVFARSALHVFDLDYDERWARLDRRVWKSSEPLSNYITISRGEELGKKNLPRHDRAIPKGRVGILAGEDVDRYLVRDPRHSIDPSQLRKPKANYQGPKVLVVKTGQRLVCSLDQTNQVTLQSLYNIHLKQEVGIRLEYLLGILNSTLLSAYIRRKVTSYKKLFPQLNQSHVRSLPIRRIDFDDPGDVKTHDRLVVFVDRMLDIHKRLADTPEGSSERVDLERRIGRTERQVDDLIYRLYDIMPKERKIVEGK